jgi:hypothetical protein
MRMAAENLAETTRAREGWGGGCQEGRAGQGVPGGKSPIQNRSPHCHARFPPKNIPPPNIRPLFMARTYDDLLMGLVARRRALGWSQQELDHRAGWADGVTGKLESGSRMKTLGPVWFLIALQALGVDLVAVERGSVDV